MMARLTAVLLLAASTSHAEMPEGFWTAEQADAVLERTLEITVEPALDDLTDAERAAIEPLLAAGEILHELYLVQRHAESLSSRDRLRTLARDGEQAAEKLLKLHYLFRGPVATTLDNEREPFVPVEAEKPGKTLYPAEATRESIMAWLAEQPAARSSLLGLRTVVRGQTRGNIDADLARLERFPAVAALNPGLRERLESLTADDTGFYAVPYALAYAPELARVRASLYEAASLIERETPDFGDYLRLRAGDLLSSNYEAGDAAWVSGDFAGLNLQAGSYETYDDALFGAKAFYGLSLLARDAGKSAALAGVIDDLQALEDALPYDHQKSVRQTLPIGIYNVIADFGQARGTNTATILPKEADHTRKYGRTILIRNNMLTHPELFAAGKRRFDAVFSEEFRDDLTQEGRFNNTLWHEIGHYVGVDRTADGRALNDALGEYADMLEEMKSDLVSLYAASALRDSGYYDSEGLRSHYASGALRTLLSAKPRPDQPYRNMRLMQFNFFIEFGLLEPDFDSGLIRINYDRYHRIVGELLNQVLHVQFAGDRAAAAEFVERWNYWEDLLHGRIADLIRKEDEYRYRLVRYAILED